MIDKKVFGLSKMRIFILLFFLIFCAGCATKYQVVADLGYSTYHMHNVKRNRVEIITTEQKLEIGKWYNLKSLK